MVRRRARGNRRVNSGAVDETVLHAHGGASQTSLLTFRGEVKREVLDDEQVIVPECLAESGVAFDKHGVPAKILRQ